MGSKRGLQLGKKRNIDNLAQTKKNKEKNRDERFGGGETCRVEDKKKGTLHWEPPGGRWSSPARGKKGGVGGEQQGEVKDRGTLELESRAC